MQVYTLIKRVCEAGVAGALCYTSAGFFTTRLVTKLVKSSDQSSSFLDVGSGFVAIIKVAVVGCVSPQGSSLLPFLQK